MSSRARVCAFTDALLPPYDEGIRKVTQHIYGHLAGRPETLLLATHGGDVARIVPANRALLNAPIAGAVRSFRPDVMLYIPEAAMTVSSVLRARVLKVYGGGCPVALLSMQPRTYPARTAGIVRLLRPDLVLTQASAETEKIRSLGCRAVTVPTGVDLDKFSPVSDEQKSELRRKYGVGIECRIVLHVGHIKENRNVGVFERLQRVERTQCILVGSTSTEQDRELASRMKDLGVIVVDTYQPCIEELYQLADLYVFPVKDPRSAITLPLSVLEALACNVPVVATRFGGLTDVLPETDGIRFVDSDDELVSAVADAGLPRCEVRSHVERFSWDRMAAVIVEELEALVSL